MTRRDSFIAQQLSLASCEGVDMASGNLQWDTVRPLAILGSYLAICFGITTLIVRSLYSKASAQSSSRGLRSEGFFAALACLSLVITWYYMLAFFSASYQEWSTALLRLGTGRSLNLWLKDTKLFEQAWGTAVATPARYWWTQQIFFFSAAWSVFLGREGHRRNIPHLWAYMLLGQIVAISFATNLFFVAVLLHPLPKKPSLWAPPLVYLGAPLAITLLCAACIPSFKSSSMFMPVLLLPHVVLFIPPVLHRPVGRNQGTTHKSQAEYDQYYSNLYKALIACAFVLQVMSVTQLPNHRQGVGGIADALNEHPAVSSVGWDVILCWVTWAMWLEGQRSQAEVEEGRKLLQRSKMSSEPDRKTE